MLDTQSSEDLAPLLQRRRVLRGTVRAEGWALADRPKLNGIQGAYVSTYEYSDGLLDVATARRRDGCLEVVDSISHETVRKTLKKTA